jgi:hypothetical protein
MDTGQSFRVNWGRVDSSIILPQHKGQAPKNFGTVQKQGALNNIVII